MIKLGIRTMTIATGQHIPRSDWEGVIRLLNKPEDLTPLMYIKMIREDEFIVEH